MTGGSSHHSSYQSSQLSSYPSSHPSSHLSSYTTSHPSSRHSNTYAKDSEVGFCGKMIMMFFTTLVFIIGLTLVVEAVVIIEYERNDLYFNSIDPNLDKYTKSFLDDNPGLMAAVHFFMYVGFACMITGIFGCIGTVFEKLAILGLFFLVVVFMLFALFAGFIILQVKFAELDTYIRNSMKKVFVLWFDTSASMTENMKYIDQLIQIKPTAKEIVSNSFTWVVAQEMLECCGLDGPKDWMTLFKAPPYAAYCAEEPRETLKKVIGLVEAKTTTEYRTTAIAQHLKDMEGKTTWDEGCGQYLAFVKTVTDVVMISLIVFVAILAVQTAYIIHRVSKSQKPRKIVKRDSVIADSVERIFSEGYEKRRKGDSVESEKIGEVVQVRVSRSLSRSHSQTFAEPHVEREIPDY